MLLNNNIYKCVHWTENVHKSTLLDVLYNCVNINCDFDFELIVNFFYRANNENKEERRG